MEYDVAWSPIARITYFHILDYLNEHWSGKEVRSFIERTKEVIGFIKTNPLLYPAFEDKAIHKCVPEIDKNALSLGEIHCYARNNHKI